MDASGDLGRLKNAPPPDDREEIGSAGEPAMTDTMAAFIEAAWCQFSIGLPADAGVAANRTQVEAKRARLEAEAAMAEEVAEARAALDAQPNGTMPSFRAAITSYADKSRTPSLPKPNGANGRPIPPHEGEASVAWSDPQPLPNGLLAVAPFDIAFLPDSIAPWVADIAERMQCPVDFVAITAMVALGAVIGRKVAIRPQSKTDWFEVPNLWGCVVGPPGAMKTPAMSEALVPLDRLEGEARKKNETLMRAYGHAAAEHKLRKEAEAKRLRDALKKGSVDAVHSNLNEPKEPKARRYIVNDTTYEKLGEILVDNPNGVLEFRDELLTLLKTLDREEFASARGFFLTAWSGKVGYTFDRIIRGTKHIEAACVSLLGSTQPGKLAEYVRRAVLGGQGDDGMI